MLANPKEIWVLVNNKYFLDTSIENWNVLTIDSNIYSYVKVIAFGCVYAKLA